MSIERFSLAPGSLKEAMEYANIIAKSDLAPKDFKGKPENVLVAVQMGAEVGLSPMQAIQNIAVINGRPSIWGDAALALIKVHPSFSYIDERLEGKISDKSAIAYCEVQRKGQPKVIKTFSVDQAIKAGLWSKPGPWSQYPERMLQMRARSFALRDAFPDALRGLHVAEESIDLPKEDYSVLEVRPKSESLRQLETTLREAEEPEVVKAAVVSNIHDRATKAIEYFVKKGCQSNQITNYLGISSMSDITEDHLDILSNIKNEIKEGNLKFENAFIKMDSETGEVQSPGAEKLNEMANE